MDKYLSIITNFGCHYTCPYCIVTNNNLHIPKTTIQGLRELKAAIINNDINIVSVSGGGDPLYEYYLHKGYYKKLFSILNKLNVPLEMHTSYVQTSFPTDICNRVVYHLRDVNDVFQIKRKGNEIIRVVFVVDESFSQDKIDHIVSLVKSHPHIEELSFRQMVDKHYKDTDYCKDYLQSGHKKDWYYITQCDYNLYYAENQIYRQYSDFKN